MTVAILIIGISVLILIHEFGHFIAAKFFGRWVEEFGIGFPPRLFSKKIGETVYSVNALPFGGFVRIHGEKPELEKKETITARSFSALGAMKRAIIIFAGIGMNFLLGWVLIAGVYMVGTPTAILVGEVVDGTPAFEAGIRSGDLISGFSDSETFIGFITEHAGEPIALTLIRGAEEVPVTLTPRTDPPEGEGALGISISDAGQPKLPFFASIWQGLVTSVTVLGAIFAAFAGLFASIFTGGAALEQVAGPVGIFQIATSAADFGLAYLFQFIGLISLNLAVLNLLPIPALDGGRLFFILIEKLKGSPVSPKREATAHAVGFVLLILLMLFITVRDVIKLF